MWKLGNPGIFVLMMVLPSFSINRYMLLSSQLFPCEDHVVLEPIVTIFRPQKVSTSIHRVGNKRKERHSYTVMSDNAVNKMMCVLR